MKKYCAGCFESYDNEFELCPHCGYIDGAEPKESNHLFVGTELADRYVIGNVLGFGGFGITYKAWDKKLETAVAIKEYYPCGIVNRPPGTKNVLLFSGNKKREFDHGLSRFIDEARNTIKFNAHRNIVHIYEYFEENSTAYFVMEFLDGCNLSDFVKVSKVSPDIKKIIDIMLDVCSALKDIHASGIIHRDISPDNIFLTNDGGVKLIDFGAARFSSVEEKNFTIVLKPGFAPPEQYTQTSEQGPQTDIYALGATLYYCIAGTEPEESTNRKANDTLVAPKVINPNIEQYLSDSIMKAMAMEPALRFKNIDEFEKAIKNEVKVKLPTVEKKRKKMARITGILVLFVFLSVVLGIFLSDMNKKKEQMTLDAANIKICYINDESENQDILYQDIISSFCNAYPNIVIESYSYSESEYHDVLTDIENGYSDINLFVSDDMSEASLHSMLDLYSVVNPDADESLLSRLFNKLSGNSTNFTVLDDYENYFPDHKQVPLGFNVPVIYVNSSFINPDRDIIGSLSDFEEYLNQGNRILVDTEMYDEFYEIFSDADKFEIQRGTINDFTNGEANIYFSSTSNFFEVRNMTNNGVGVPKMLTINQVLPCKFSTFWSILPSEDESENQAAIAFLSYMLSTNAQNKLLGENKSSNALPINDDSLDTFASVFDEFAYIIEEKDNFKF